MSTNEQVAEFMRCLEAKDLEGCVELARIVEASPDEFEDILSEREVQTSAAILSALDANSNFRSCYLYVIDYWFNPFEMDANELDRLIEASPDWYQYEFIVGQGNLSTSSIVDKCEALGWGNDEILRLVACESFDAVRTIEARTTRQDVRDALISRWGNETAWDGSYVIKAETLIQSGRFNALLVNRDGLDDATINQLLSEVEAARAYIDHEEHEGWVWSKHIEASHAKLLAAHNDPAINRNLLKIHNAALNPDYLAACATDKDREVREHVALNASTPTDVLKVLAFDKDKWVAEHAQISLRRRGVQVPATVPGSDKYGYILGLVSDWVSPHESISVAETKKFVKHLELLLGTVTDDLTSAEKSQFATLTKKVAGLRGSLAEQAAGLSLPALKLDASLSGLVGTKGIKDRYATLRKDTAKLAKLASDSSVALEALEATLTSITEN